MKLLAKTFLLGAIVFFTLTSVKSAVKDASFELTAKTILVKANHELVLSTDEATQLIQETVCELNHIFEAYYTDEAKERFTSTSDLVFGELLLTISDNETAKTLNERFNESNTIADIQENPLGIEGLDAVNKTYQATEYTRLMSMDSLLFVNVKYSDAFNPFAAAHDYNDLDVIDAADLPVVMGSESAVIERFSSSPTLYKVKFGWGDCVSGCIYGKRFYFETTSTPPEGEPDDDCGTVTVVSVGDSGDEMPDDMKRRFLLEQK